MTTKWSALAAVAALLLTGFAANASAQTITISSLDPEVGAGLQTTSAWGTLSDSQHGGISVHIASSDSLIALVSPAGNIAGTGSIDVFVSNGSTKATFYVQGLEDTTGTVSLIVSASGFAPDTASIDVVQPALEFQYLDASSDAFDPDDDFRVAVGISNGTSVSPNQSVRAGGMGLVATITNSNSSAGELITLPDTGQTVTVTIDPGVYYSPSYVSVGGVAFDPQAVGFTTISASIPGFIQTSAAIANIEVTQPYINATVPDDVGAGLRSGGQVINLSGSQHGGIMLHVESSNSSILLLSNDADSVGTPSIDIEFVNGDISEFFYTHGVEGAVGTVTLTFSAPGFTSDNEMANTVLPFLDLATLSTSQDVLDPIDDFSVRVGLPNGSLTGVYSAQNVRPGSPGLTATITSSDFGVGHLVTLVDTSDTVAVTIEAGKTQSPSNVAAGGVALDGVGVGTTTITATIPGFITPANGSKLVTVTQPTINVGVPVRVGAGLRANTSFINLGASQHGGVTVTVQSLDPSVALVSQHADSVGQASISIFFSNGDTSEPYYVHGVEDTTGTVFIAASTPLFSPDTSQTDVVVPGVSILSLTGSIDTLDPADPFVARVGAPYTNLTGIQYPQDVRPGSPGVTVTVSVDDSLVGKVLTQADTSGSIDMIIPAGAYQTPSSVASGGLGFKGLSPGDVDVTASAPGFVTTDGGIKTVTVTAPTISLSAADVGAGLQTGWLSVTLSASGHPGVFVHVESMDSALALVSTGTSVPGTPSVDVFVPGGSTSFLYYIHGLEDTVGTSSIVASTPFFAPETTSFDVVQPGVLIGGLVTSIDVLDVPDAFYAKVGKPTSTNSTIGTSSYQLVRAGSPGLTVTLVTDNPVVSQLIAGVANDTVTVTIPAGNDQSSGAAFDGLSAGTAVVTASIPGFITVGTGTRTVFVTNQNLFLLGLPIDVGSGLQSGALTAFLGESSHGGTTVKIESADTTLVRLSTTSGVAGDPFVEVYVPNGSTDANYFVQAAQGTTGTVLLTGSATGFPSATDTVHVVMPMVTVSLLADSMSTSDGPDEFIVQVGVPNEDSTAIGTPQVVGGGTPLDVILTSTYESIGRFSTNADTSAAIAIQIPPGQSQTPGTFAGGGVRFEPRGPGITTVTPAIAGFLSLTKDVKVSGYPVSAETPLSFALQLGQNYPNPFNPTTTIRVQLPEAGHASLIVYDVAGRRVATLIDGYMPRGIAEVRWNGVSDNGQRVSSGIYFYRLQNGGNVLTKKMTLLK